VDMAVPAGACNTDPDCKNAAQICCSNVCVETASCALAVTQVVPSGGFQNGGEFITLHGAGFATGMKVLIEKGRAAVQVIDAATARIQAPPGPVGMQDLTIVVGGAQAILRQGYSYRSAGLETAWEQKPLTKVRGEDPGLAVMQDGRVLVAGGTTVPDDASMAVATAEIYTRSSDTVALAANSMSTPRWQNSAVTLLGGKVLVVGGASPAPTGDPQAADLFDPATNMFTPTANKLNKPRFYTHAVLMVDGRVFISSSNDPDIEIYDPKTDAFTLVTHTQLHQYGFVVRLRDGRILVGGGDATSAAELYDSDTNAFTPAAGAMTSNRSMLTAHTLPDGRVFAIGGANMSAGGIIDPTSTIDIFDPVSNTFTAAPYTLATTRCWHASALVRDGTILVMGGYTVHNACNSSVATVESIDPVAGQVTAFSNLPNTNTEWTAVTLLDGSVLGVGGGACGTTMALPDIDFLAGAPIP
ncbi:MAG: IPT/TIG domain-containing protein, partial [Polyangia bacterium]